MQCDFTDVGCHLDWLVNKLEQLAHKLADGILDSCIAILSTIPVPDFFNNITNSVNDIPPSAWFFMQSMEVGFGFSAIVWAYVFRFCIRRLPFVG